MHSATPIHNNIVRAEHLPPRMHSTASPPPSQQYCNGRSFLPPGCNSATLLNKENIMAVIDLRMATPPHPQQYCKGGALASQDAQHTHHLPLLNNIAWEELLPPRMHSATLLNKENIMAVIDLRMASIINKEKEEEGDSNFAEHLITNNHKFRYKTIQELKAAIHNEITSIPGNVLEWTMQNASLQKEGI
ncbi:hypothetical protein LSTR_LSTR008166 [Laodelphax striatellus]|uniref:Uncharacterized protein n=1 Tax=Laodelphax striatellus TaxID=195883 RepID=A0A482WZV0_LAOST|nr:hypothetical protein LSTR_LSTR008166 [Laodelphax striatellus]